MPTIKTRAARAKNDLMFIVTPYQNFHGIGSLKQSTICFSNIDVGKLA